jgi:ERCC4-type nuclease
MYQQNKRNGPMQSTKHNNIIRQIKQTTNPNQPNTRNLNRRTPNTKPNGETMKVQISDKEQNRIKQAEEYFTSLGCETEVTNLQYGDYVFDGKVAIEYKTMADFIASI